MLTAGEANDATPPTVLYTVRSSILLAATAVVAVAAVSVEERGDVREAEEMTKKIEDGKVAAKEMTWWSGVKMQFVVA